MFVGLFLVAACAVLNRVRGGGFCGDALPGRALFWVAPVVGLLAWTVHPWTVSLAFAAGYLFWGLFSWGYTMAMLGGHYPDRPMSGLELFLAGFGPYLGAVVRMLFVLPGVAAVSYLLSAPSFLLSAPVFALVSTEIYRQLFVSDDNDDWQNAEIATGALWGLLILSALVVK